MNVRVLRETTTTVDIGYDKVPGAEGYAYYLDGKRVSRTLDPDDLEAHFRKPDAKTHVYEVRALEVGDRGAITVPAAPVPPPPTTTGPVDTGGKTNLRYADFTITIPTDFTNVNRTPFYLHGQCSRLVLERLALRGGYDGIKQYSVLGDTHDIVADGVNISDAGGDGVHWNGGINATLKRFKVHQLAYDFTRGVDEQEHHDGAHLQAGHDITLEDWEFRWELKDPAGKVVRRDYGSAAVFANASGGGLYNVNLIRPRIPIWTPGRGIQMFVGGRIEDPFFGEEIGLIGRTPRVTLMRPGDGRKIVLVPGPTGSWQNGVQRSDFAFNDWSGPGFPNYVQVVAP